MARPATNMEKLVFGEDVEIDPITDLPIERGIGCLPYKPPVIPAAVASEPAAAPASEPLLPEMPNDAQAH